MEDIARECRVTKMTVSRVLAGREGVKKTTRDSVLAAVGRLDYEINALAQSFNSNRSGFIGIATPFDGLLGSSYFEDVMMGFRRVIDDSVMSFALFNTNSESFNNGDKLRKLYRQRRADGLLLVALHTTDSFLETLEQLRFPMVVVGERASCPTICSVSCRDERGIGLSCNHLYKLGHRRIAFVAGPEDFSTANRRKEAFLEFRRKKGLEIPASYIQRGEFTMSGGRDAGRILLRGKSRPTAIVAANDRMAFGVMESARELGMVIPRDLSVVGFDDEYSAAEWFPALTTVRQPVIEMGEQAAKMLLAALADKTLPAGDTVMDVSLILRESTAPPR